MFSSWFLEEIRKLVPGMVFGCWFCCSMVLSISLTLAQLNVLAITLLSCFFGRKREEKSFLVPPSAFDFEISVRSR